MVSTGSDVAVAFLVAIGAGLASCIGGAIIFCDCLLQRVGTARFLAASLALSGGVMSYVSFVEIFSESISKFEESGFNEGDSYLCGTLSFFGGFVLVYLLDVLVHFLDPQHTHEVPQEATEYDEDMVLRSNVTPSRTPTAGIVTIPFDEGHIFAESVSPLSTRSKKSSKSMPFSSPTNSREGHFADNTSIASYSESRSIPSDEATSHTRIAKLGALPEDVEGSDTDTLRTRESEKKLRHAGIMTALAIAFHNFPEGIATFVATLDDPKVGGALGVAIAVHNIPEGLAVAVPMYYATGNKMKAFMWASLAALVEPLGAVTAWLFLADHLTELAYGIMFGLVGGMMISVSIKELLPAAWRHDPYDEFVSNFIVIGMVIMAASLVGFQYL